MNHFLNALQSLSHAEQRRLHAAASLDRAAAIDRMAAAPDLRALGYSQGQFRQLTDIIGALDAATATQGQKL